MRVFVVVSVGPMKPSQLCEKFPHTNVYRVVAKGETGELNRLAGLLNEAVEGAQ